MYKNDYLENYINNNKSSKYLVKGYDYTVQNKFDILVIKELGFIYSEEGKHDLMEFKDELIKANIKEFLLIEKSSDLMDILHVLNFVNIKIVNLVKIDYRDKWEDMHTIKGIKMEVES
jgi:hypothetical protein